ncbi:MAG: beta strand repeat-containing protein, partial [Pyrinomonadaceae bacterium]
FNFGTGVAITNPSSASAAPAGVAFYISGSNAAGIYNGSISDDTGFAVDIDNHDAGTFTFAGSITSTAQGLRVANSNGGTINFDGPTKNLNTGANQAVTLDTLNSGGTVNFGGGGLNIDTTTAKGFSAAGGGTITVTTGTNPNTIDSTTGTALNVDNTAIGASGLTFRSVASNGAASGIILNNTGAGGLTVAGNGGTCSSAATCTGGAIQNSSGPGISLTNVAGGASFNRIAVTGGGDDGIRATNVGSDTPATGILLANSRVSGNGNAVNENGLDYNNIKGISSIQSSTITGSGEFNARFANDNGIADLTVSSSTFSNNSTTSGADGLLIYTDAPGNTAKIRALVQNSTFQANADDGFQLLAGGDSSVDLTFNNNTVIAAGNAGAASAQAAINFDSNSTSDVRIAMTGGNVSSSQPGLGGSAIIINPIGNTSSPSAAISSTFDLTIDNVTIGTAGVPGSGSATGQGFRVIPTENTAAKIVIKNSHINGTAQFGMLLRHNDGKGTSDFTVTGNTIRNVGSGNEPIFVQSGSLNTDATTVCSDIGGSGGDNTNPPGNDFAGQASGGVTDIAFRRPSAAASAHLTLPGFSPPASTNLQPYIQGRNVGNPTALNFSGELEAGPSACAQPASPALPTAAPVLSVVDAEKETTSTEIAARPPISPQFASPVVEKYDVSGAQQSISHISGNVWSDIETPNRVRTQTIDASGDASFRRAAYESAPREVGVKKVQPKQAAPATANSAPAAPAAALFAANFPVSVGTINPGDTVTITFQVTVNNPFTGANAYVENQGTVSGSNFSSVLTDDPDTAAPLDKTRTPVVSPPHIRVNDARLAEPATGQANMLFTVTLDRPNATDISVGFQTQDGGANPATGGNCSPTGDYLISSGSVTVTAGQTFKTISVPVCADADNAETDETFLLNLTSAPGAVIDDAQAVGTITLNLPGTLLISELRTSGPGAGGAGDANDDFVEVYNNADAPVTVADGTAINDAAHGYGVYKTGAACVDAPVLVGIVPNGTVIPARGHYLLTGTGYSLSNYGGAGAASGNATLSATAASPNLEADKNVALFSTADVLAVSSAKLLDAVGFTPANTGNNCDLLREGTNLAGASGAITQYSFVRDLTTGFSKDTNDNAADFFVVSTTPSVAVGANPTPRLGAPGPENLASPTLKLNTQLQPVLINPAVPESSAPNRTRDASSYTDTLTPSAPNGGAPASNPYTLGTLSIQRRFINQTGAPVTRLRFRVVSMTAGLNNPNLNLGGAQADIRLLTSNGVTRAPVVGGVTFRGLTLEQTPPTQALGGGWDSTVTVNLGALPGGNLGTGQSVDVQFLLGVAQSGKFAFFVIVEGLP